MNHWAAKYIGIPWSAAGQGPDSFNCWHFFQKIQLDHYKVETSQARTPFSMMDQVRLIADHPERLRWTAVAVPADGDAVLMGRAKQMTHIGTVIEAEPGVLGALHCVDRSGVIFTPLSRLPQSGWPTFAFYRRIE